MKKLMILMSIFLMTGLVSMEAVAQTPNSSRSNTARTPNSTAVTKQNNGPTSSQAARQIRKGDAQLNKANSNYQKAQLNNSRINTNSRPAATTSRPATTSSASKQTTTPRPAATSTTSKQPSTATTARPTATSQKPTTTNPTTSKATTEVSAAAPQNNVSNNNVPVGRNIGNSESATTSLKRGYTEQGQAQPQPVSGPRDGGNNNNSGHTPGPGGNPGHPGGPHDGHGPHHGPAPHTPYVHPNYHNYYTHMHVPRHVRPVYYHGTPYYFYNSVFCRYINGYYVVCRPPLGAVIAYAIFNTWKPVIVVHNKVTYYYDDGTFYLPYQQNYQVVTPPIGARVAELPSNYEEIILDNTLYYKVDNVYYKAVVVSGYIWYEVVFVS